jgi:hypothetical protein
VDPIQALRASRCAIRPMGNSHCSGFPQLQCLEISELHSVARGRVQRMLKMRTNCVSTVRRCREILLFVGLVSLVPQLPAQDTSCRMQSDRVSAAVWGQIPPPPGGIAVAFFDNATVQVGLNQVYADSQKLTHRWRSFIPWMSSGIVSVFPFSSAIQSPASRMPLFYVNHAAAALDASEPDAQSVHLVRATTKHDARVVQITSGWSAFSFHPGFTPREEVPLRFQVLSSAVYTIQPERPLDNGEYLVIFGPSALSGFEFQIACSGAHRD